MAATAADLPEELFKGILIHLVGHFQPNSSRPQPETKRNLSACSLTCRYWARLTRAHVFYNIILRSKQDLDVLMSFVDSPNSTVGSFVRGIVIQQNGRVKVPWAHRVYTKLHRLPNLEKVYHKVMLETQIFEPMPIPRALRSVHEGIPRSLPSLYFRCTTFHLSDIPFMDLVDLLALVGEMSCESVDLVNVSWFVCPKPENPPPILRKFRRSLQTRVRAYSCTNGEPWRLAWLCITTKEPRNPEIGQYIPYVQPGEMASLDQFLCWTASSIPSSPTSEGAERTKKLCTSREFQTVFGYREFVLQLSCLTSTPCSPDYEIFISNGLVVRLRVIYSEGSSGRPMAEYEWEELDRLAAAFSELRLLIITAHTANGDLDKQESVVRGRMPQLQSAGKLMFRTMDRVTANPRW